MSLLSSGGQLCRVNPFECFPESFSVMIRQLPFKAILPFDEGIQDHLVRAEIRPALFRFSLNRSNDFL